VKYCAYLPYPKFYSKGLYSDVYRNRLCSPLLFLVINSAILG
jgi:hypothetical protein